MDNKQYILPDISKSKCNQAMKFGQLIEYNMRNILLEKSCTNCGGRTSPWINSLKFHTVCF